LPAASFHPNIAAALSSRFAVQERTAFRHCSVISPANKDVGRPVAVTQLHDGSLPISDEGGKKIWRVTYGGGR
jgi:glucose/arabinose dehydrogenase